MKNKKTMIIAIVSIFVIFVVATVIIFVPKSASADKLTERLNLGEKYLSELNYEQAVLAYNAAIEIDPKNVDAYTGLIEIYLAQGDYDMAEEIVEQALAEIERGDDSGSNGTSNNGEASEAIKEIERLKVRVEAAKAAEDGTSGAGENADTENGSGNGGGTENEDQPEPTMALQETLTPEPTSTPTVEPTATPTPEPTATPTPEPTATPTPSPSPTPSPTPTPVPVMESTEASFEVEENEDGTVTITKYIDEQATIVIIPETIGGKKVTGIGSDAFKGYSNLVIDTVDIGGMTLGEKAFNGVQINNLVISSEVTPCKRSGFYYLGGSLSGAKVLNLEIKEGVQSIPAYLFTACDWLTEVTLPSTVTSIGREAFAACNNLTSVNLDSVTDFGYMAFNKCNNLVIDGLEIGGKTFNADVFAEVTINTLVLSSSDGIYYDKTDGSFKSAKVGELEFSSDLDVIPDNVFRACSWLTEVEIPNTVTVIGEYAFISCSNLTKVVLHEGLTEIKTYAFRDSGIAEIELPVSLTTLGKGVFYECLGLTEISIPGGVTKLSQHLFQGSKNLERVIVTDSITKVDYYVFKECGTVTIVAPEGSYMAEYAVDKEYPLETY